MEPMKKNRPKTVEELIKAAICTIPYASEIRNASQNSDRSAEKTIIPDEYYNDFHIHWNTGDESLKNKIRKILKEMREIGNKERITNTGFKEEPSFFPDPSAVYQRRCSRDRFQKAVL